MSSNATINNTEVTMESERERLMRVLPGQFIQVRHDVSFWPEGLFGKPAEKTECYSIEIGWPKTVYQFSGSTFQECVAQARAGLDINLHEDETCAECHYGAIDNLGLCVMDSTHQALPQAQ